MIKKVLATLVTIGLMHTAQAEEGAANLQIKIAGATPDNNYFLCIGSTGCLSILAGERGKVFPLTAGQMGDILTASMQNQQMYVQPMPASCQGEIHSKQNIIISGTLQRGANNQVYVQGLTCRVS